MKTAAVPMGATALGGLTACSSASDGAPASSDENRFGMDEHNQASAAQRAPTQAVPNGTGETLLLVNGSFHESGACAQLAMAYADAARAANWNVVTFDAAATSISGCIGCDACGLSGPCVFKDEMESTGLPALLSAKAVAFVSPICNPCLASPIKVFIDRFYSRNYAIQRKLMEAQLIAVGETDAFVQSAARHYKILCDYMGFTDAGRTLASGISDREGQVPQTMLDQVAAMASGLA